MSDQPTVETPKPKAKFAWPRYKAGNVEYWISEAGTVFVNGFINGLGGASFVGVGVGAAQAGTELGSNTTPLKQFILSLASLALSAFGSGVKEVIIWHKANQFPNPWPKPTGSTAVPWSDTPPPPS